MVSLWSGLPKSLEYAGANNLTHGFYHKLPKDLWGTVCTLGKVVEECSSNLFDHGFLFLTSISKKTTLSGTLEEVML